MRKAIKDRIAESRNKEIDSTINTNITNDVQTDAAAERPASTLNPDYGTHHLIL